MVYIPSYTLPAVININKSEDPDADYTYTGGLIWLNGPRGLPLTKPPYGRITAIDLSEAML